MRASRVGARRVQFAYMQTSTAGGYASLRSASTRTSRVYDRAWLYRARFCASVCVALMLAVGAATVIFVGAVVVASLFDGTDAWIRKASEFSRGWVLNAQSPRPIAHIKSTLKRADLSPRKVLPPPLPLPPPPTSPMRPYPSLPPSPSPPKLPPPSQEPAAPPSPRANPPPLPDRLAASRSQPGVRCRSEAFMAAALATAAAAAPAAAGGPTGVEWFTRRDAYEAFVASAEKQLSDDSTCAGWCSEQFRRQHCEHASCHGCTFCEPPQNTFECEGSCVEACLTDCSRRGAQACGGVAWRRSAPGRCELLVASSSPQLQRCDHDAEWQLIAWLPPPAPPIIPPPPAPPPTPPALPPTSPPPPRAPLSVEARLNARFMNGRPSSSLLESGVLVRQMDIIALRSPGAQLWGVSMDRIVGSIVSQLRPYMYSTSAIGFVLSPEEIGGGAIRCSYATDAGSLSIDRGCKRDGSAYAGEGGLVHMLNEQIYGGAQWGSSNCLWGSATSEDRSTCMYNEVVIDAPMYEARLPRVVEAFFYPVHAPVHTREGDAAGAWRQRSDFLRTYGGGGLMAVPPPPMLEFNVQRARDGLEPFSLVRS